MILSLSGCATAKYPAKPVESAGFGVDHIRRPVKNVPTAWKAPRRDSFLWPVRGTVISSFAEKVNSARNKGIDIRSMEGAQVKASRAGTVVFLDNKFKGFGKTVILDHGDNFQTVYAYNSRILVNLGDEIEQNEQIAKIGRTGRAKEPSLHFEIRKNGEPCNPSYYLPQR